MPDTDIGLWSHHVKLYRNITQVNDICKFNISKLGAFFQSEPSLTIIQHCIDKWLY